MTASPRIRRLINDHKAMLQLQADSTILSFAAAGDPPELYEIRFRGRGLAKPRDEPEYQTEHAVHVRLGAGYPRMMPELRWGSPIFHPNISGGGAVCLGGYGTFWVPSLTLPELCVMLWDMIRFENFDIASPYNREAATWVKQDKLRFPLDPRPLRDRVALNSAGVVAAEAIESPPIRLASPAATVASWGGAGPRPPHLRPAAPATSAMRSPAVAPPGASSRGTPPPVRANPASGIEGAPFAQAYAAIQRLHEQEDSGVTFLDDASPQQTPANAPLASRASEDDGILFLG